MNTYQCACGSRLFFENTKCLKCAREVGWCRTCQSIRAAEPTEAQTFACTVCSTSLVKCHNYEVEKVCNRFVSADMANGEAVTLCRSCQFTKDIPDLNIEGNRRRWYRLERGKRRLFYTLDYLQLPYGLEGEGVEPPLSFHFKADPGAETRNWRPLRGQQQVYTGHAHGKITINLREADPAEREKLRVNLQEEHRTIIGHFRHEIAHYYWEMLVQGKAEDAFIEVFGDHNNPSYADAMKNYYDNGPAADWTRSFVSAYASMHPWEDFAETFASYLDLVSVLETAANMGLGEVIDPRTTELKPMLKRYQRIGVVLNEMNRDMGLKDLVPEVFVPPVAQKMRYVHDLVRASASGN